jgi:hypothetical protein
VAAELVAAAAGQAAGGDNQLPEKERQADELHRLVSKRKNHQSCQRYLVLSDNCE